MRCWLSLSALTFAAVQPTLHAGEPDLQSLLAKPILAPQQTHKDLQKFLLARLPALPKPATKEAWAKEVRRLREEMFAKVVFRGEAAAWRKAKPKVEWLETLEGGPGYRLKQVRFEALPGLWIPALLYEPEKLLGKVPAALCVMGHDGGGKDVAYQQIRCINLARRGMLALNLEWFAFGQLSGKGFHHGAMNQLDLCGTSGLAPFYLAMERGLDVLLAHPSADPQRVAVSGLSGGGWQTIYISALDPRVSLTNPVAGYSSFRTRIQHWKDLGDSEQTPCDMATVADYDHLTAMMAPRATLLTYNAKDECCFEAGYALPPLFEGALPFFNLYDRRAALRTHVNNVPGTHNYERENREAFYRMIGDHFFPNDKAFRAEEIACEKEVRPRKELAMALSDNLDFNKLALALAKNLPRNPDLPKEKDAALAWQKTRRDQLAKLVKLHSYQVAVAKEDEAGAKAKAWRLTLADQWTLPLLELTPDKVKATVLLIHDGGRTAAAKQIDEYLKLGRRVVAVDPLFFGEGRIPQREYLWGLLVSAVGERPLGLQASQLSAVARWSGKQYKTPIDLVAVGPRSSLAALLAAALDPVNIRTVECTDCLASLKEIIEQNRSVDQVLDAFCFGLLEHGDIKHLAALVAPRQAYFPHASRRFRAETADLHDWYRLLGATWGDIP